MWTGVLFAAIAAVWLVILVPYYLRKRSHANTNDEELLVFSPAVTIVHSGDDLLFSAEDEEIISTPLTRKAELSGLRQLEISAASRRRRVLGFLLLVELVVALLATFGIGSWWGVFIPAAFIVAFLVIARFSVKIMNKKFAARRKVIMEASEEETVAISITAEDMTAFEQSIELSAPLRNLGSLMDEIPVTRPTYVSQPLAARTVRTIDLSAPAPVSDGMPVTNDTANLTQPVVDKSYEKRIEGIG